MKRCCRKFYSVLRKIRNAATFETLHGPLRCGVADVAADTGRGGEKIPREVEIVRVNATVHWEKMEVL
jgi:hypothetical protein